MEKLSVRLLGPSEVRLKGEVFEIPRRAVRVIVYYLAFKGGMAGLQDLTSLLYHPENPTLDTLEDTLLELRLSLPGLYRSLGSQVGLDRKEMRVDLWEFQDLVDQAGHIPWQTPPQIPLPEPAFRLINQASRLWRSPNFLEGEDFPEYPHFTEWLAKNRQLMERKFSRVAERLAEHHFANGNMEQTLQYARLALAVDPFNENLHRLVLLSLIFIGNYPGAEDHFKKLETDLRNELGTSPSPSLIAHYRAIHSCPAGSKAFLPTPEWKIYPGLHTPFIGRRSLLQALHQVYQEGGGVLVIGEPGQGKTRLLQEFFNQLFPAPRVLLTACRAAENSLPFQPFIDLLRHQVLPEEWLTLPDIWARQVSLLLPEIAVLFTGIASTEAEINPGLAHEQARAVPYESIRQVFLHLRRQGPLVVCLDDAQWSDEATLATIAYLLERPPFDTQACLVFTARSGERSPHLDSILPSLHHSSRFRTLNLNRLAPAEIHELVCAITGSPPDEMFIQQLDQATGGNPLFILETLRSLEEGEGPPSGDLPLAKSWKSLIHTRLDSLTPVARHILEAGAILGSDFDPEILAELSQQPKEKVMEALVELERRLLVQQSWSQPDQIRYGFIHEKIRTVLVEEINPLQQGLLNARVAHILKETPAGAAF